MLRPSSPSSALRMRVSRPSLIRTLPGIAAGLRCSPCS
jgi:hypothetical protein